MDENNVIHTYEYVRSNLAFNEQQRDTDFRNV